MTEITNVLDGSVQYTPWTFSRLFSTRKLFIMIKAALLYLNSMHSIIQWPTLVYSFAVSENKKNLLHRTWWRRHLFSRKNESDPLFDQSLRHLTTVKLGFDQIRTMSCVSSSFRCTLLFLVLFVASQALTKPGNNANSSSSATKHCNNVYNSFYAGPNKKIETILIEMKTQLTHVENEINILKGNKTSEKGKYRSDHVSRKYPQRGAIS